MRNPLRVRTQLVLLSAAFIGLLVMVAGLGCWQAWRQNQSIHTLYEDRVVPLRQIKSVSDMYAVNIVDTAHKFADGSLTPEQSLASLDHAMATIQRDWSDYLSTYLVSEERALIDKLKPLMAAADGMLPELRQAIQSGDRARVADLRTTRLYPVTQLVSAISIASREQNTGLSQISGATSQIDQSTQQTVALVEESAAAAVQLREQATRLVGLVSTFKLPNQG